MYECNNLNCEVQRTVKRKIRNLAKDKLNIVKLTFTSGVNVATEEYKPKKEVTRYPLCGVELNENGVCPKCGYKKL